MNTFYARLNLADREKISQGIYAFETFTAIAEQINRPISTVSNEIWRNVKYSWCYRAEKAQERSNEKKKKGCPKKLDNFKNLFEPNIYFLCQLCQSVS